MEITRIMYVNVSILRRLYNCGLIYTRGIKITYKNVYWYLKLTTAVYGSYYKLTYNLTPFYEDYDRINKSADVQLRAIVCTSRINGIAGILNLFFRDSAFFIRT